MAKISLFQLISQSKILGKDKKETLVRMLPNLSVSDQDDLKAILQEEVKKSKKSNTKYEKQKANIFSKYFKGLKPLIKKQKKLIITESEKVVKAKEKKQMKKLQKQINE